VFDVLPRLGILEDTGVDLHDRIDYFVVPGYFSGYQIESLTELGIGRNRVISSLRERNIEAERLLVPSLPRRSGVVPTWVTRYLKRAFPAKPVFGMEAPKRIYITRKITDHGLLDGEDQLLLELDRFGFTPLAMEDFTLSQKHWLLSNAEAVIGPSGAGLANIVFCQPGTKIIELRVQPIPLLESWDIANRCGLDYYDVLPMGYGKDDESPATDPWGLVFSGSIARDDILAALAMAGL
jgi:capsular polysaccharide biosynthesis protein